MGSLKTTPGLECVYDFPKEFQWSGERLGWARCG
jgi:hypothetical protein